MSGMFKRPLSRGEIAGYFIFVGGLVVIASRNLLSEFWVQVGIVIMAIGVFVTGRYSGPAA